jgi:predicted metal-dependent hydrolase
LKQNKIYTIDLSGNAVTYRVRKRKTRSQSLRFQIDARSELLITVPSFIKLKEIPPMILRKADWILKQLEKIQSHPSNLLTLLSQNQVFYRGLAVNLKVIGEAERKRSHFSQNKAGFILKTPASLDQNSIYQEVIKGLKRKARKELKEHLDRFSLMTGIRYKKMALKDTKTRWGSCSSLGNINLSWRLVLAPAGVAEYVALHELCHLKEANHSKKFWDLVGKYMPDYKERRKWLKENGWWLHTL